MDGDSATQANETGIAIQPSEIGSGSRPAVAEPPKTRACANCARLKMKCRWPASGAGHLQDTSCIRYVVVREMNVNGWDDADLACPYVDAAA
jgi:hypothetical protein